MKRTPRPRAIHKTTLMREMEEALGGRDLRLVLVELYNQLGTQVRVARRLGVSQATVHNWFVELGIQTKQRGEASLKE